MTVRTTNRIRNIGIIAHVDAGKTTLTERILFYAGSIRSMGGVDSGDTTTDHDPIERQKGITIKAAAVRCEWRDHAIHLIDTPGHADFNIEVERSLRVLDGAVVLLDGVAGVEPQTEKVWRQADRYAVPRVCFVNKLDRAGASFERCLESVRDRLGATALVVGFPIDEDSEQLVLVDVVRQREISWSDPEGKTVEVGPLRESVRARCDRLRSVLTDACADADPAFETKVLEAGEATEADFIRAIKRGTLARRFVPTLGGSALANRGVQPLLDAVIDYLPSPEEGPRIPDGGRSRPRSVDGSLVAYCFKVAFDRFGQLTFLRVYAGELRKGAQVESSLSGRKVRIGRLVRMFADQTEDVDVLRAGDIGAVVGGSYRTGETLYDASAPIALEALTAPAPVVRLAIEPVTSKDRDRMGAALMKLLAEDPSLALGTEPDTGQTLLAGLGQLHLAVTIERLRIEHHVEVRSGRPKVAFKETIRTSAEHEHRHVKQGGGPGQWAQVRLRIAPLARGLGFEFEDRTKGGVIAAEYIPGVRKGVEEAMLEGALGHPVTDLHVTLVDGAQHSNDSSELAFKVAARAAFRAAYRLAKPALLEPIMRLEVLVSDEHLGAVLGDLGSRRANVVSMDQRETTRVVRADAPLAEMFGYSGALNALTHGRGQHSMTFAHYREVPDGIVERLDSRA